LAVKWAVLCPELPSEVQFKAKTPIRESHFEFVKSAISAHPLYSPCIRLLLYFMKIGFISLEFHDLKFSGQFTIPILICTKFRGNFLCPSPSLINSVGK